MEIDYTDIYNVRMLVFMEESPQSNVYRQVILTPSEFKRVSKALGTTVSKEGSKEMVELACSEDTYTLPDLNDIDYGRNT